MPQIERFIRASLVLAACLAAGLAQAQSSEQPAKAKPPTDAKASSKAVAAPKIEVTPETKDAGVVPKGQMIESTFVVKNTGGSDLIISDARPGCGCTVASFDKVIKPGSEGKVMASVDTKNFSGPISKSLTLVSNDPERSQLNLFIKATVKPFVDILPQPYVRISVVKGDTDSHDVILVSEEKSFKPTLSEPTLSESTQHPGGGEGASPRIPFPSVPGSSRYVQAEIQPAGEKDKIPGRAGDQYKLHITVTADAPEGLLNTPIRVATGVTQQPNVEVPVSGIVRARVSVTPLLVNFGNFTAGKDPITRNVFVTNNKPQTPVKVTKAEVTVPGFLTDVVPTQEGVAYTVVVKASDKVKKGTLSGTVKLYTTDKEKAVIELPLRGEAL